MGRGSIIFAGTLADIALTLFGTGLGMRELGPAYYAWGVANWCILRAAMGVAVPGLISFALRLEQKERHPTLRMMFDRALTLYAVLAVAPVIFNVAMTGLGFILSY